MKKILLCMTLLASFTAHARDIEQVNIRQERSTQATGNNVIIAGTVSQCSYPGSLLDLFDRTFVSLESSFGYTTCSEYSTKTYNVKGDSWNTTSEEVPGTEVITYQLEHKTRSASQFLYSENNRRGIDYSLYILASESVLLECQNNQLRTTMVAVPHSTTRCK